MWDRTEDVSPWRDLRKQIIELPEDDGLRLQFASDWEAFAAKADDGASPSADERVIRPERASLIRLQIQLDKLPSGASHPDWFRLRSEVNRLLISNQSDWTPSWFASAGVSEAVFSRGFIEGVTVTHTLFLDPTTRKRLFNSAPIRHLNIVGIENDSDWEQVLDSLRSDELAWRILSLNVDGQNITDEGIDHLAASALTSLAWLSAAYNRITESGVRRLAEVSAYGRLRSLKYVNLRGNPMDPVDQLTEDQGVVTGVHRPEFQEKLPPLSWLRRDVVAGRVMEPDRFSFRAANAIVEAHSSRAAGYAAGAN